MPYLFYLRSCRYRGWIPFLECKGLYPWTVFLRRHCDNRGNDITENKRADLTQIQAVIEENKSDIYIDGYSLKTGDVYVNHGKLYIEKGE